MLINEVLESDQFFSEVGGMLLPSYFRNAYVVRAQNVHDYFMQNCGRHRVLSDFPNVAPTMPAMWFEWVQEGSIVDMLSGDSRKGTYRLGVLCLATDLLEVPREMQGGIRGYFGRGGIEIGPETRWAMLGYVSHRILGPDKPPHLLGRVRWRVGPQGEPMPANQEGAFGCDFNPIFPEEHRKMMGNSIMIAIEIAWLALSFMHCKNVRIEKGPPIPERLSRARDRKGKPPLFRYHTVVIEPARMVAAAQESSGNGIGHEQAIHICRGHFKRFEGRGLFGRHTGTYWWGMHTRGSSERGVVDKDYEVRP